MGRSRGVDTPDNTLFYFSTGYRGPWGGLRQHLCL